MRDQDSLQPLAPRSPTEHQRWKGLAATARHAGATQRAAARAIMCLALVAIIGLAWYAYQPGLSGGFLFDDWVNLDALGAFGPVDNSTTLWRYLTSGKADVTGRPLALATFLLDARDWPADPSPFKRTAVILHLLNGLLLALLLRRLGRAIATSGAEDALRADIAAVLGAGLWLLHPLFVSTTLYVVQREAMLPATFILTGLIGYLAGRQRAVLGQRYGVLIAAGSIAGSTVLATLCKANGALLPLLAWLLDAVFLAPRQPIAPSRVSSAFRRMKRLVIELPSCALLAFLAAVGAHGFIDGTSFRPWTTGERLLTQARVLVDYLDLLWLPRPYSHGLFNDSITVSRNLLAPPSTLACILFLGLLSGGALALRKRWPIFSGSLLFFFLAHLMESSVIALELYFEHRNYVPALLLFWPLSWWLADAWIPQPQHGLVTFRRSLSAFLPFLFAGLTFLRADLWGNTADQALLWGERNPHSPRAQAYAAQLETNRGDADRAIARIEVALAKHPHEVQLAANLIDAQCKVGSVTDDGLRIMAAALERDQRRSGLAFNWLSRKLDDLNVGTSSCRGLGLQALEYLVEELAKNPNAVTAPGRLAEVHHLRGRVLLLRGNPNAALTSFDTALKVLPTPGKALSQAAILANSGHPELGLRHLDKCSPTCGELPEWSAGMRALHARLLESQGYWEMEVAHLRKTLDAERRQPVPDNRSAVPAW